MAHLFERFPVRGVVMPNRIIMSPMCQYSSVDGLANEWHAIHLGARAVGGVGLVFTEASAVTPEGRISPGDLGIWSDRHAEALAPIVRFIHGQGGLAGIQLAHAGRKASTLAPSKGQGAVPPSEGGWCPVGPTDRAFASGYPIPRALIAGEIRQVATAFGGAARRALAAGFDIVEIHAAHGYLIHEFLSPLSNARDDAYGGGFDNRIRLCLEIVDAVRQEWPERQPLFIRISATDWHEGGWDIEQSVQLSRLLRDRGVDLVDCSSGGNAPASGMPIGPGYQTPFAARIRRDAGIATGAVGLVTAPAQADHIVRTGQADCVFLARELLRDPYWSLHAARELGHVVSWPVQYLRAAPAGTPPR
jgi:2,4-dienoyl-CoA reductase-like NADH-dependent reductase (Old Yellow Enzyme family)